MDSYGFYIHGRSPHGFAETDMLSMILQFKREEENLCSQRGLIVGNDHQTFSILAPKNLRMFYEKLILPVQNSKNNGYRHNQGSHSANNGFKKFENNFEKIIVTYHNINRFFGAFIDHVSWQIEGEK